MQITRVARVVDVTVLVTGGAGYIGAHVVRLMVESHRGVLVVDDFSTGSHGRVSGAPVVELDVAQPHAVDLLAEAMVRHAVTSVVHFAGRKRVAESVARPAWYYQQNVTGLANVVAAMEQAQVEKLVFSSSAAVYGNPAVSIPAGTIDGLPMGLQVLAPHHRDGLLFDVALAVERERPWPLVAPTAPA